jgi:hypothetical protein
MLRIYSLAVTTDHRKALFGVGTTNRSFDVTDEPKTLSVPQTGRRYFDLARNASYEAARRGEIPTIRIGARLRVPIVQLERMLTEGRSR